MSRGMRSPLRRSSRFAATLWLAGCAAAFAAATPGPAVIAPDAASWVAPAALPGVAAAWLLGGEQRSGPYVLRVKLAAGARIGPHTHPDERYTTVLQGTLYVGFGSGFDGQRVVAVPEGAIYVAPAGVPHYVWARDGAVVYQEAGTGPTATAFAAPPGTG